MSDHLSPKLWEVKNQAGLYARVNEKEKLYRTKKQRRVTHIVKMAPVFPRTLYPEASTLCLWEKK